VARTGSAAARGINLSAAIRSNLVLLAPVIRNMIDGLGLQMARPLTITANLFLVVILRLLVNPGRGVTAEVRAV
jgi:hypothetical protein